MKDGFQKAMKIIDDFRVDWNYLERFGIPSFWGYENRIISKEDFQDKLKATRQDLGCLSVVSEGVISAPLVINLLCKDFNIAPVLDKLI